VRWLRHFPATADSDIAAMVFDDGGELLIFGETDGPMNMGNFAPNDDGLFLMRMDP
jgi:hypothetical protein